MKCAHKKGARDASWAPPASRGGPLTCLSGPPRGEDQIRPASCLPLLPLKTTDLEPPEWTDEPSSPLNAQTSPQAAPSHQAHRAKGGKSKPEARGEQQDSSSGRRGNLKPPRASLSSSSSTGPEGGRRPARLAAFEFQGAISVAPLIKMAARERLKSRGGGMAGVSRLVVSSPQKPPAESQLLISHFHFNPPLSAARPPSEAEAEIRPRQARAGETRSAGVEGNSSGSR